MKISRNMFYFGCGCYIGSRFICLLIIPQNYCILNLMYFIPHLVIWEILTLLIHVRDAKILDTNE